MSTNRRDEELLEKEWSRMTSGSENVIMSEDLIARVHPYNINMEELSQLGAPSEPAIELEFSDYTISGRLVSYSNNPGKLPVGESTVITYTLAVPNAYACKVLTNSSLKSYKVLVANDTILENDYSDYSVPADITINWTSQDEALVAITIDTNPKMES